MVSWMGREVPLKSTTQVSTLSSETINELHSHFLQEESEDFDLVSELYADDIVIKDRKYQAVTREEVF